jgi:hypothetical protein
MNAPPEVSTAILTRISDVNSIFTQNRTPPFSRQLEVAFAEGAQLQAADQLLHASRENPRKDECVIYFGFVGGSQGMSELGQRRVSTTLSASPSAADIRAALRDCRLVPKRK